MSDGSINLSISAANDGSDEVFAFHLRSGRSVIASNQALTLEQSQRVRDLSWQYGELFERRQAPKVTEEALATLGSELFSIWLAPFWANLTADGAVGDSREILISSSSAWVLNLPWELLRPPGGEAIGVDGKWTLRRLPMAETPLGPPPRKLPPGPLRVLYMVAAPTDQAELDHEKEEELLLRALSRAGHDVVFDSGDLGSFDELEERISDFRPHIVHLTGHGVARDDAGYFAFENEHGATDLRPATEVGQLFAGQDVQCAFISACQAGKAPNRNAQNGLAQGLLTQGVPLVIGWTASVLDDVATEVGARFYREVANGRTSVDRALISARQHARRLFTERSDPSWSLPVLYSATRQEFLFDATRSEARPRTSLRLEALPGMSEEGFTPHFIGRRRELQQLLPALRTGRTQLTILTGLGGAGKSTLATRLARKLEADGWTLIASASSNDVPLSAAALLETCGDAFLAAGLESAHSRLRDPALEGSERLRLLVNTLNEHRFVLVLDNFESNLDTSSRKILDPEISDFYQYLLARLQGKSRAIITSRYLPSDVPLPQRARELQLGEFGEAAFLKFMLRDPSVERRYREGDLPHDLLVRLHGILGGTPRFLGQIRKLLATIEADELGTELDSVVLPTQNGPEAAGALQAARDAYCESIFTARLYASLSEQSQQMLRRIAVLGLALPRDGLAAIGGLMEAEAELAAKEASHAALLHDVPGGRPLWSVYGILRSWLMAPERMGDEERRTAHLAAGDYLGNVDRQNREEELGVNFVACRQERFAQYLLAKSWKQARDVAAVLSDSFLRRGLYVEVVRLNNELLQHDEHPQTLSWIGSTYLARADHIKARECFDQVLKLSQRDKILAGEAAAWHQLASIDLSEKDYPSARQKFERSLAIEQQIGNPEGEAATWYQLALIDVYEGDLPAAREKCGLALDKLQDDDSSVAAAAWHQLASIDIQEGDYPAAQEKLRKVLKTALRISDRVVEAATWYQLGILAEAQGDIELALRLISLCWLIDSSIGHGDSDSDSRAVAKMAAELSYTREQLDKLLREVADTYAADRGASLLLAFDSTSTK